MVILSHIHLRTPHSINTSVQNGLVGTSPLKQNLATPLSARNVLVSFDFSEAAMAPPQRPLECLKVIIFLFVWHLNVM